MALELAFYLLIRKSILIYPIVSGFFVGCFPVDWRLSVGCFWVFLGLVLVSLGWFWIACGLLVCCFWVACQIFVNCFLDASTENPFPVMKAAFHCVHILTRKIMFSLQGILFS